MKVSPVFIYLILICIISVLSFSEDIKNLYDFFNLNLPENGNGCINGIVCSEDQQHIISLLIKNETDGNIEYLQFMAYNNEELINFHFYKSLTILRKFDFSNFPLLPYLNEIVIYGNIFINNTLPSRFFDLPSLKILETTNSEIKTIPQNVNSNSPLEEIVLKNNYLEDFPIQFNNLNKLKKLYLNNNKISKIPVDIANNHNIEYINIENNEINGELVLPSSLINIDIYGNSFDKLHEDVNDKKLQYLNAYSQNFDDNIFKVLKSYPDLKELDLSNNYNIKSIPSSIQYLTNLKKVNVSNTNVSEISSDFYKLSKIKYLDITNIPIDNLTIINFKTKTPLQKCNLDIKYKFKCMQSNTCEKNFRWINDCTQEEIDEVLKTQSKDKPSNHFYIYIIAFAASFAIVTIMFLLYSCLYNKPSDDQDCDIVVTKINTNRNSHFNFRSSIINNNYLQINDNNSIGIPDNRDRPPSYNAVVNNLFTNIHNNLAAISNNNDDDNNIINRNRSSSNRSDDNVHQY